MKPANVLITAEASPKLADFNISFSAKVAGSTPDAYFGGSLAYMSPEQLEACDPANERKPDDLDGRSDFYSLGVVLWELLTGFRPFLDENVSGGWSVTLAAMVRRRQAALNAEDLRHVPGCPAGLTAAMQITLAPDRNDRWQNGREMARRLELCTNPRASELLFPRNRRVSAWKVLTIFVLAGLLPNVLAGWFNNKHNDTEVVSKFTTASEHVFKQTRTVVNAIAYPLGTLLFLYFTISVLGGLAHRDDPTVDKDKLQLRRRRCLRLGSIIATISLVEWTLASCVYPLSLRMFADKMPVPVMAHFFFSVFLCGIVAAVYPFFGITYYSVRRLYPLFVASDTEGASQDGAVLRQIGRWNWICVVVACSAPMLAVAALVFDKLIDDKTLANGGEMSLAVFSLVGAIGFAVVFRLFQLIQSHLETLSTIIAPNE